MNEYLKIHFVISSQDCSFQDGSVNDRVYGMGPDEVSRLLRTDHLCSLLR